MRVERVVNLNCLGEKLKSLQKFSHSKIYIHYSVVIWLLWKLSHRASIYANALKLQLSIILEEAQQNCSKIRLVYRFWNLSCLEERNQQQEKSIWTDSTIVRIVKRAYFEILLQHQNERLDNFIVLQEFLNKLHTLKAVVIIC